MSRNKTVRVGRVAVRSCNGSLQIYFSHEGKRHCLGLGLKDNPTNWAIAQLKAKSIDRDIEYDEFDSGLTKYKETKKTGQNQSEVNHEEKVDLTFLWNEYIKERSKVCTENTMYNQFRTYSNYLKQLPTKDLKNATRIVAWISNNLPRESGKRFIVRLNACCKLGIEHGHITNNPFERKSRTITTKREKQRPDPFTREERDAILECLRTNAVKAKFSRVRHSFYYPYLWFSFYTGARPGEVSGLSWDNIEIFPESEGNQYGWIHFEFGVVRAKKGRVRKKGLKTEEKRVFPINKQLYDFLSELKQSNSFNPENLVFVGFEGGYFDPKSFAKYSWKKVLKHLNIRERKMYCTRATFITLALQSGAQISDLSRVVGNSPTTLLKNYSGFLKTFNIPNL